MRVLKAPLSGLLLLLATDASAQDAPVLSADLAEEADVQFRAGAEAYRAGRYDEALQHLLLSNRLVPNRNVVFNIARAYEQSGQFNEAFRHYNDYVRLETDGARKEAGQRAIDRIRDKVALVQVQTDPPGADVYVDRVDLGTRGRTPIVLALPPGPHELIVELKDHVLGKAQAELVTGKQAEASVKLDPILGTVHVGGSPAGAEVRVGDEKGPLLGKLPADVRLPPGPQVLVVSAQGYRTLRQIAQVVPDGETETTATLELITGTLVVNAIERDALVEIDGNPAGFTPAVLDVPVGPHELRVSLRGHYPHEQIVEISAESSLTVDVPLRSLREVSAATRSAQSVDDVPASVTLIGAREIRAFGYQSLYQALADVRGVFQSNDLTYRYLGFRGFSTPGDYGNRVLVTVDGHTMNDDMLGASYVAEDFEGDLDDVQQIEVVRGPGSALYGSNAFFGVVNVVTAGSDNVPRAHARVTADVDRVVRARVGTGFGDEDVGGWVSAVGVTGQGNEYVFPEWAGRPHGTPDGSSVGNDGVFGRTLQGRAWAGDFEVQAFHNGREKEIATAAFGTRLADDRATSNDYRSFGELRYSPTIGTTDVVVRAWLDSYRFWGAYPYGRHYVWVDTWQGMWAGAEPRLIAHPTDWLNLTAGAEVRQHFAANLQSWEYEDPDEEILASNRPVNDEQPTSAVYSGYAIAELVAGDWARLSAGGRVDAFDTAAAIDADVTTFNPRLALVLSPGDRNIFKVMGGTAFRAPSVYEYLYWDGGLTQVRPDSLTPERILTGELEYTHRFDDVTSLTAAVYHNQIYNLIGTEDLPGGVFRYANTDDVTLTLGGEYELRRDWRQGWMAALQHSLQQSRVGNLLGDDEIVNSPPHVVSLKGAIPLTTGDATLATTFRNESPRLTEENRYTDWAHLVDVMLTGDVPRLGAEWGVGVRNLLDWKYTHPTGADLRMPDVVQPGRSAYASLRVSM